MASLLTKIEDRSTVVGVVGLGYVGLPLLHAFCDAGFPVVGFDIDPQKFELLHGGENYLKHLGEDLVRQMHQSGRFDATDNFARLVEVDAILICVPTPLDEHLQPDLGYLERTSDKIAETLRGGQLVVLESTTYPDTTREILLEKFKATGLRCGQDYYLAYSPEREDPGRADHNTRTIPKLIVALMPPAAKSPRHCTTAQSTRSFRSATRRSRSLPSSWRTSTAR